MAALPDARGGRRWLALAAGAALLAALVPPAWVATQVARTAVDVPYWDHWPAAARTILLPEGIDWPALWRPHNEHRLVVQGLVQIALARVSDWDVRLEIAAIVAACAATLGILAALALRAARRGRTAWPLATLPAASALVFHPAASDLWSWGFTLGIPLGALATAVAAAGLGARGALARAAIVGAAAALALLSFGSGLVPLGLAPVALLAAGAPDETPRARRRRLASVAVVTLLLALLAALYLRGLGLRHPLPGPRTYVAHTLAFLGAPFSPRSILPAAAAGMVGLLIAAALGLAAARGPAARRRRALPWAYLAACGVATALMIGAGRSGSFGASQALTPRYLPYGAFFWIGVAGVAATFAAASEGTRARRALGGVALAVLVAAGAQWWLSLEPGTYRLLEQADRLEHGRRTLLALRGAPDRALRTLFVDSPRVRYIAVRLAQRDLGPYAPSRRPRLGEAAPPVRAEIGAFEADGRFPRCLVAIGRLGEDARRAGAESLVLLGPGVFASELELGPGARFAVHVPDWLPRGELRLVARLRDGRAAPVLTVDATSAR